jgi:predicted nucleic-acid-binding Zn-ribbon protein
MSLGGNSITQQNSNMKNCPKCNSTKIMESAALRSFEGHKIAVSLTQPSDSETWFNIRTAEHFEMFTVVCGECGYSEMYTERPQEMSRRWESGYR